MTVGIAECTAQQQAVGRISISLMYQYAWLEEEAAYGNGGPRISLVGRMSRCPTRQVLGSVVEEHDGIQTALRH